MPILGLAEVEQEQISVCYVGRFVFYRSKTLFCNDEHRLLIISLNECVNYLQVN